MPGETGSGGTTARAGWAVGLGLGALVGLLFILLGVLTADGAAGSPLGFVLFGSIMMPPAMGVGAAIGGIAQSRAKARFARNHRPQPLMQQPLTQQRFTPWPPATRQAMPPHVPAPPALPPIHPEGIGSGDWAGRYQRCRTAVRKFHAIVDATAPSTGRDWMRSIAVDLTGELDEVLRLVRYGVVLAPAPTPDADPTALELARRLDEAETAFEETVSHAGRIAVELTDQVDFERIRAELTMLAEQAPRLR